MWTPCFTSLVSCLHFFEVHVECMFVFSDHRFHKNTDTVASDIDGKSPVGLNMIA